MTDSKRSARDARPGDWHDQADAYLAYFEDNPDRLSTTTIFPRLLTHFGDIRGLRVLDFGCGQGRFSRAMADAGAHVVAFDASSAEVANARARDGGRNIRYIDDPAALAAEGPFDRILCFMVLLCNALPEAEALLRRLHALTAPGGCLGLGNTDTASIGRVWPDFYSSPPAEPTRGAPYQSNIPTSAGLIQITDHFYSPADIEAMLFDAGFVDVMGEHVALPFVIHVARRP